MWTLAADGAFQTIFSGGRDRKVYAIDLSQGREKLHDAYIHVHVHVSPYILQLFWPYKSSGVIVLTSLTSC